MSGYVAVPAIKAQAMAESRGDRELAAAISDLNMLTVHMATMAVSIVSYAGHRSEKRWEEAEIELDNIQAALRTIQTMQIDLFRKMEAFSRTRSE